jgi:hypothetical protein
VERKREREGGREGGNQSVSLLFQPRGVDSAYVRIQEVSFNPKK